FSLMCKNMRFETIIQICRIIQPNSLTLFLINGINLNLSDYRQAVLELQAKKAGECIRAAMS
ncbi:MAG: hypothetical protein ACKVOH_00890, partial [Chlamydiales bacterium]